MELPNEIWMQINIDNPAVYHILVRVSKIFQLNTDDMKAKLVRKTDHNNGNIYYTLPNGWLHSCDDQPAIIFADGDQRWFINGTSYTPAVNI